MRCFYETTQINGIQFPDHHNELLSIELEINNIGVAPMYYDWDVEFGILSDEKELLKIIETDYKTTNIFPGETCFLELKSP